MRKLLRKLAASVSASAKQTLKPEEFTLPRKLAVIDREGYVHRDDPQVGVFADALQGLAYAARVTEQQAADISVRTQEMTSGRRKLLQVMLELRQAIPVSGLQGVILPERALEELAAAYLLQVLAAEPTAQ